MYAGTGQQAQQPLGQVALLVIEGGALGLGQELEPTRQDAAGLVGQVESKVQVWLAAGRYPEWLHGDGAVVGYRQVEAVLQLLAPEGGGVFESGHA